MALLHHLWRPYTDNRLNLFDGVTLQLIILISNLPLIEFFDSFDTKLVIVTIYVLVLLPLMGLIAVKIWIHRNNTRVMIVYCSALIKCKRSRNNDLIPLCDCETQLLKDVIIVDDSRRRNATIVDV